MIGKKGFEFSFAWIFAIIIGGVILFLAVFISVKLIGIEQTTQDAKTGKEIGILLNPLETGFESGKTSLLKMPVESRIYNKCNNKGYFGRQIIQVSQKSFSKWSETDIDVGFSNKYLFSERYVEGKKFYVFSKPFEFPFKISDVIYITSASENYCFIDAPEEIYKELENLKQANIKLDNCVDSDIKVCFSAEDNCDIQVDYDSGYLNKGRANIYFESDALMYAGIFSDEETYECQLKRLMQRVEQLALLYKDKANFVSGTGCNSNTNSELVQLSNLAENFEGSFRLKEITTLVEEIKNKNDDSVCKLW